MRVPCVRYDLNADEIYSQGRSAEHHDSEQWKLPFGGRQPAMEDDLRWRKTTSDGRGPSMGEDP